MTTDPTHPTPTENTDIDDLLTKAFNDFYDYITEKDIIKAAHEYSTKSIFLEAKAAIEQKLTGARIDELNRIVKAEDYVWTASNEDNQYEFNVEIYATRRILDLQASKEGK